MANNANRVPRTTAQLVAGLSRILRENLDYKIKVHEHWTFEFVTNFGESIGREECDKCPFEYCYTHLFDDYEMEVYLVSGEAGLGYQDTIDIKVRIEKVTATYLPDTEFFYYISLWIRSKDGEIRRAGFTLWNDGHINEDDHKIPELPPKRIAFWKEGREPEELIETVEHSSL